MTNAPYLRNAQIADRFDEVADLLAAQGADRYRVAAYHHGARTLRGLAEPVGELLAREGVAGLMALPTVGRTLAQAIVTILRTGELPQLRRLRGDVDVEQVLMTVPGIGPTLAARLHDALHITSLERLEIAAHDGRLERLAGFGPRRVAAVRAALAARLGYVRDRVPGGVEPPVEHLLDVDREYQASRCHR
jgi:DNA polymerase IV (family X)